MRYSKMLCERVQGQSGIPQRYSGQLNIVEERKMT
jgi:hypothetical protein